MSESSKAVFLSYASQDAEAAKRICDALRAAGVEVWFDQSELVGGDAWDAKIRKQIKECALLLPIISANTQSRTEGYFRLEWRLADQRTHLMGRGRTFLLPVCIDDTKDADADVPDSFSAVQWTRAKGGEVSRAFATRVKNLLDGSEVEAGRPRPAERGESAASPARRGPSKWWWALPMFGVAMALLLVMKEARKEPAPAASAAPLSEARQLTAKATKLFQEGDDANRENFFLAEDVMKRAVALDNTDAEVWAAYGQLSVEVYRYGFDRSPARLEAMRTQVERAIKLDANSIAARLAEAAAADYLGIDQVVTEAKLRAMERRAPDSPQVLRALGQKLGRAGKIDESLAMLNRASALAPANPKPWADASAYLLAAGRFPEAEAIVAKSLARQANGRALGWSIILQFCWRGDATGACTMLEQWPAWFFLEDRGASLAGLAALWNRDPAKALAIYQRMPRDYLRDSLFTGPRAVLTAFAHELAGHREAAQADWRLALQGAERELAGKPGDGHALYWKAWASARLGEPAVAEVIRQQLEQRNWAPASYFSPEGNMAGLALVSGNSEQAIAVLQRAVEPRPESAVNFKNFFVNYPLTRAVLELNPLFDPLRGDERFKQLLAKAPGPTTAPTPAAGAPKVDDRSVAVLAFANLSDDKANEYFSDGISEEILNALAKIRGLKVIARTSAFYFRGRNVPVPEIGRQLGVTHLVEGTVRKAGNEVRVRASLVSTADGAQLWAEDFRAEWKEGFALQDEIAGRIAQKLQLELGASAPAARRIDPEAHRLVIEGRHFWNQRSPTALAQAAALYRQAIDIAPGFAEAYAGLADIYQVQMTEFMNAGEDAPALVEARKAQQAAERARELDPGLAEPYATLGYVLLCQGSLADASASLRQALTLNPNLATAHRYFAPVLSVQGRLDLAVDEARRALEIDPLSLINCTVYARFLALARRPAESLEVSARAVRLQVDDLMRGHWARPLPLWALGRRAEAVDEARLVLRAEPPGYAGAESLWVLHAGGQEAEARQFQEALDAKLRPDSYVRGFDLVAVGRVEQAWPFLQRIPRGNSLNHILYYSPLFDAVRDDPRFEQVLAKLGYLDEYKLGRETLARMSKRVEAQK